MCGFIGIVGGETAAFDAAEGMLVLQHRGQDAAGITSFDGEAFHSHRGTGLVQQIFHTDLIASLRGSLAIGHTRYPTVGGGTEQDAQPLYTNHPFGIAMAHNGNVTNFQELKRELAEKDERRLGTECDVEAILNVFAAALRRRKPKAGGSWPEHVFAAMKDVYKRVRGSYSGVALVGGRGMVAFRDPYGIKPAILGRKKTGRKTAWCVCSESAVLNVMGYEIVGDLEPGEVLVIAPDGTLDRRTVTGRGRKQHRPCIFEFVYFARPDSVLDDISVYKARIRLGEVLAARVTAAGLNPDVVVPVPDSARPAALECARALDVRYREGLLKNRYVGRTFIMPQQENRERSVRAKLTTLPMELEGKKVLLIDDSVVRGTTTKATVAMVREAGAKAVYVGVSSPKIKYPCPYGIDMQTRNEFVARSNRSEKQIAERIGADAIVYLSIDDLVTGVRGPTDRVSKFCHACMDGKYPTGDITPEVLRSLEGERNRVNRKAASKRPC
ncbi:MAG: amidophosphoribosyltransferase [Planctomycetota bacterium]|nr:amidophosphoribosyltransferase [Planctomycetota bacterium]